MSRLPSNAPALARDAFAHINAVTNPTLDDLKLMVFLEASALNSYFDLARGAPNPEIKALLEANGREELAHAHRVSQVIKLISGEDFPPPAASENPYVTPSDKPLEPAILSYLVTSERNGCTLYETWAGYMTDPQAANLLRQNGKEEIDHANRAAEALERMPA